MITFLDLLIIVSIVLIAASFLSLTLMFLITRIAAAAALVIGIVNALFI